MSVITVYDFYIDQTVRNAGDFLIFRGYSKFSYIKVSL